MGDSQLIGTYVVKFTGVGKLVAVILLKNCCKRRKTTINQNVRFHALWETTLLGFMLPLLFT